MKQKQRLFYLDFVRAVAVISIVMIHFNTRFLYIDPPAPEKAVLTTSICNVYLGDWGVSLFLILSGASLMYVYRDVCDWKYFYKKRFLSIYPMFWIAYTVYFFYLFYINQAVPGGEIPKGRFLFSVLAFDGLLRANGYPTFYLLGEWFLGLIVLLYLLFPVLRKLLLEKPKILLAGIMIFYIAGLVICGSLPISVLPSTIVFVRLPELVFGMFFVKYGWKIRGKAVLAAGVVLAGNAVLRPEISSNIQTTYVGIASFVLLVFLAGFLQNRAVQYVCGKLSQYSYAIFLVHHVVIAHMMERFDLSSMSRLHSYLLFVVVCGVIAFFSWMLYHFHRKVMGEWKQIAGKR